jgi:hypothetical protein
MKDPSLRSYSFKEFAAVMFKGVPELLPFAVRPRCDQ